MNNTDPVVANALSISAAIIVFKAVISLGVAMAWWSLSVEQNSALLNFLDVVVPIIAVWVGVVWTKRNVTPLAKPRDVNGEVLSRAGDVPAVKEYAELQKEAVAINKTVTRGLD